MNDFFDTGVIIGTSYIQNIEYGDFDPQEIDKNSKICQERFNKSDHKVICNTVQYELINIIKRRKVMHKIILMELSNADEDRIIDEYMELEELEGNTERDTAWISNVKTRLNKYDIEEVYHLMEEIRNIFELNIINLIDGIEIFKPSDLLKELRGLIKDCIYLLPIKPNSKDITIFSNALIYHNKKKRINFISVDKAFENMSHAELEGELKSKKYISHYPLIEVLS